MVCAPAGISSSLQLSSVTTIESMRSMRSSNGLDISMLPYPGNKIHTNRSYQWKAFNFIDVSPVRLPDESSALFGVRFSNLSSCYLTYDILTCHRVTFRVFAPDQPTSSSVQAMAPSTSSPRLSASCARSRPTMPAPSHT